MSQKFSSMTSTKVNEEKITIIRKYTIFLVSFFLNMYKKILRRNQIASFTPTMLFRMAGGNEAITQ
ncbi:MAG: hypothetical protein LBC68_02255 [Prevotellaceae bacterium]|jgi:hypothetical protein|nr:hypothetical protein [Prevotellaceae bacterium]